MRSCPACSRSFFPVILLSLGIGVIAGANASAQTVLRVFGSEGPSPAISEAAAVFSDQNKVEIQVVSGPTGDWLDEAARTADLVYSSGEFMMSEFLRVKELKIEEASVTPLYLRPSAILVRPGNPKRILDFPDLLKPGVSVMVVSGSGQTGLWEDMAAKQGDIRVTRALRKNIVVFAANSTEAVKLWDERADIDAWITWNIWHMPLRDRAELIPVSKDYVIYRQCSIALTERGSRKPAAYQFIDFLRSPAGAKIFESWNWMQAPSDASPLTVRNAIAIVCRIDQDVWKDDVGLGLAGVRRLVEGYRSIGVPSAEVHISAVIHGDATYWMLKDKPYSASAKKPGGNPNKSLVQELMDLSVSVEVCGQTLREHGWTKDDVLPLVKIVPDAYPRIVDLQLQGYAYLRF